MKSRNMYFRFYFVLYPYSVYIIIVCAFLLHISCTVILRCIYTFSYFYQEYGHRTKQLRRLHSCPLYNFYLPHTIAPSFGTTLIEGCRSQTLFFQHHRHPLQWICIRTQQFFFLNYIIVPWRNTLLVLVLLSLLCFYPCAHWNQLRWAKHSETKFSFTCHIVLCVVHQLQ